MKNKLNSYDSISDKLKKRIRPDDVNSNNIINIVPIVLEVVEKASISGELKKKIAMSLIEQLVRESKMSENDKRKCNDLFNNGVIDSVIENIIKASNNKIKLNNKSKIFRIVKKKRQQDASFKICSAFRL